MIGNNAAVRFDSGLCHLGIVGVVRRRQPHKLLGRTLNYYDRA
jgi:hypothetical protein